jgi:preprotein translocase subunit SecG
MTTMHWIIGIPLLISALIMAVTVLLQNSERSGIGAISGAAETLFGKHKSRGMEAKLALITKICAGLFVSLSIVMMFLSTVYTVTFRMEKYIQGVAVKGEYIELKRATVRDQQAADAPDLADENYVLPAGTSFTGWDQDFSSVTRDMTVTAMFSSPTPE